MKVCIIALFFVNMVLQCANGERIDTPKTETKVEIEVSYLYPQQNDKAKLFSETKPTHNVVQFTYNVPSLLKPINAENRNPNRQTSGNNNNLRNGFRFSTIEKGAGAFTMATYENDISDSGLRLKNNQMLFGKLIHSVSISEHNGDNVVNSSSLAWSHYACDDTVNSVQGNWVALVQSGTCSAERKLRQIMKLGNPPLSILIYGSPQFIIRQGSYFSLNQDESPLVIFLPWSNIQGVVQKCFNSSGEISLPPEILKKMNLSVLDWPFNSHNQCNVTIKVYITSDDNFLNRTSVLFVSISFILLMVISLAWLMFYYVQRFRYIHTKEQFSRRLAHMAKKAVAKIPVKTLKQGDKETDAEVENCAICIECYKPSDTVRILPCMHYFHKGCIDPWLLEQRNCPMCKLNILHAYGFLSNERGSIVSEDHLSELDSSIEIQFMPGVPISLYPAPTSLIQAHCQTRENSDRIVIANTTSTVPLPISNNPVSQEHSRWTSLRLKRPFRSTNQIDRSVSLRYLSSSAEERTTFLSHNTQISRSADNTVARQMQDNSNNTFSSQMQDINERMATQMQDDGNIETRSMQHIINTEARQSPVSYSSSSLIVSIPYNQRETSDQ